MDRKQGYFITHPNGLVSHYHLDDFTDPWLPASQKPVIMFNYGCARTSEMWYHWVPHFARDYIVIRRVSRGQGKSSFPKRHSPWSDQENNLYEGGYGYDIDVILDEIVDMLNQLGIQKVIFFGEATSGEVGHYLAAKNPDRPEAIMNLGTRGWNEALSKTPRTLLTHDAAYTEWLLTEAGKTTSEGLAGYVIFLTKLNSRQVIKDIDCPYLILAPTSSAVVPKAEIEWQASQAPNVKVVTIEAPGHEIFVEAADACIKATRDFLDDLKLQ
ncbi:Alpha/Beta hydrolase protein [Bisporella sp. PMI_857]|nr:Alpha/Beta hydrolase protein [Bisporella sp. PMI_857]